MTGDDDLDLDLAARAEDHIQNGRLRPALEVVTEMLAADPEPGTTVLMALLRCQLCEFDAAMALLETLASQREHWRRLCQEIALCVVADQLRTERLTDPEVAAQRAGIAPPPESARSRLEAAVYHARGEFDEALRMIELAESQRQRCSGRVVRADGRVLPFDDLVDSDDLTGPILQAIGPRGLLDIPFVELRSVVLRMAESYHDLLWPVADVETLGGARITVRIPALYPRTGLDESPPIVSGTMTAWDRSAGYAVAVGQRDIGVGFEGERVTVGLRSVARIDFLPPVTN